MFSTVEAKEEGHMLSLKDNDELIFRAPKWWERGIKGLHLMKPD